jgi:hypothetical protein
MAFSPKTVEGIRVFFTSAFQNGARLMREQQEFFELPEIKAALNPADIPTMFFLAAESIGAEACRSGLPREAGENLLSGMAFSVATLLPAEERPRFLAAVKEKFQETYDLYEKGLS